jgi:hypothetical protein
MVVIMPENPADLNGLLSESGIQKSGQEELLEVASRYLISVPINHDQ